MQSVVPDGGCIGLVAQRYGYSQDSDIGIFLLGCLEAISRIAGVFQVTLTIELVAVEMFRSGVVSIATGEGAVVALLIDAQLPSLGVL